LGKRQHERERRRSRAARRSTTLQLSAEAVRHWRVQRGFTQDSLASAAAVLDGRKVQISYAQIRRIESEGRCGPSTAQILAALLDVDLRSLLPAANQPLLCGAPRPLSQAFVGRDALLEELAALVARPSRQVMLALEGQAGIGKTELALQLTSRLETEGTYRIFWLDAETPDLTAAWGGPIASQLGFEDQRLDARVERVLSFIGTWRGPVLIVLDNVTQWSAAAPWPRPRGSHIRWLCTTRIHQLGHREFRHFELDVLSKEAARELVTTISPRSEERPGFAELISYLDGYPIALELAASFLERFPEWTPQQYLDALRSVDGRQVQERAQDTVLYGITLERAFELLWSRLSPTVRAHWALAACFADAPASSGLSHAAGLNQRARDQLRQLHLIAEQDGRWSMHRLTRDFGRRAGGQQALVAAQAAFVEGCLGYAETFDAGDGSALYTRDRAHLDAALGVAEEIWAEQRSKLYRLQTPIGVARDEMGDLISARAILEPLVAAHRTALGVLSRTETPLDWISTQASFARIQTRLAYREADAGRFQEAVKACRDALQECTRQQDAAQWARIQSDLARALTALGGREGSAALLEEAVGAARAALEELSRAGSPLLWAATQDHLGLALRTLGERGSGTQRLEQSLEAYQAALLERTRERVPLQWAGTQCSLGLVLLRLGEREGARQRFEQAIDAFQAALLETTRERVPLDWATTQNHLGVALARLGEREVGTQRLEQALEAFRATLLEWTRERVPVYWATTQTNLGNTLLRLGDRESGTQRFEQAVEAYRAALLERTRERVALQWAETQTNLGNAFVRMGEREGGTERLEQALELYRTALLERTRAQVPLLWATTQGNVGCALRVLGEREPGTERLVESIEVLRATLSEFTRERAPHAWAETQHNLGRALHALGRRTCASEIVEEAVRAYRAALAERALESQPFQWAQTQEELGSALASLAEARARNECLADARRAWSAAQTVFDRERYPERWRELQRRIEGAGGSASA
jgi:tetratricopeptide (TPR) repeat protein